jgi:hypothetical protein
MSGQIGFAILWDHMWTTPMMRQTLLLLLLLLLPMLTWLLSCTCIMLSVSRQNGAFE